DLPGLRTTLDGESDARLRRSARPKRPRSSDTEPVGQVPSFGPPAGRGVGKTGFVSMRAKPKAKTRSTAAKVAEPAPLPLSASGLVMLPERPPGSDKSPPPPARRAPSKVAARPVTAPKPPALAHREEVREQLNAQPN